MSFSFDKDIASIDFTDGKYIGDKKILENTEASNSDNGVNIEVVKNQNSLLVEAFLGDKKLNQLIGDVSNEKEMKMRFRRVAFNSYFAGSVFFSLIFSGFTSAAWGFIFSTLCYYVLYHIFLQNLVENIYYKKRLNKFKNMFGSKENFLSFLDSLINNRLIGPTGNDWGVNLANKGWRKALQNSLKKDGNYSEELIAKEMQYLEMKRWLEIYYTTDDDDDLKTFLSKVYPALMLLMKSDSINNQVHNKQELFNIIRDKIGN